MQTHFTLLAGARAMLLLQRFGEEDDKAWLLPASGPAMLDALQKALKARPGAALRVVVDAETLDMKREDLPPVSLWARQKIIKRQAAHHFPKSFLRGAGMWRDGMNYHALHAACAAEPQLEDLLRGLNQLSNPIASLRFFPMEWPDYAAQINAPLPKPWTIALILGEATGLRQIVLKEGRPVFTRLADDCAPSQGAPALAGTLAGHLRRAREFLPRLQPGAPSDAPALLFVPSCLEGLGADESLRRLDCRLVVLKAPQAGLVPPEWEADIVWAAQATKQNLPLVPLVPFWMKERSARDRVRQVVVVLLMLFGMAGIYMGSSIMFRPKTAPAPVKVEAPPTPPAARIVVEEKPPAPPSPPPAPRLDALVYNGPEDWSVWLDGVKFTASAPVVGDLRVTAITPESVGVRWEKDGQKVDYILRREENPAAGAVRE